MEEERERALGSIIEFLQNSITDGTVEQGRQKYLEIAIQCIGEAFGVDKDQLLKDKEKAMTALARVCFVCGDPVSEAGESLSDSEENNADVAVQGGSSSYEDTPPNEAYGAWTGEMKAFEKDLNDMDDETWESVKEELDAGRLPKRLAMHTAVIEKALADYWLKDLHDMVDEIWAYVQELVPTGTVLQLLPIIKTALDKHADARLETHGAISLRDLDDEALQPVLDGFSAPPCDPDQGLGRDQLRLRRLILHYDFIETASSMLTL
ncbi:hypothetical protein BKA70DRAFT_1555959 [Coprinopsis sp. MPI-PUGE-AT-0042]|nr:hypothetical protein BKA70DRAFT_1555959 [Coprinopsis sp. MPI-PUGE-AT-0042]